MKTSLCLAICLGSLLAMSTLAQQPELPGPGGVVKTEPKLSSFNLDFPGGTPEELVKAIEKATGKPLNVIIPPDGSSIQLPPLKMNDVDVAQLFRALESASPHSYVSGSLPPRYQPSYGFRTDGTPSDTSIWYFHAEKPPAKSSTPPKKIVQFYTLTPYLDRGFTVDDITTAIQTGWTMAGVTSPPQLNYHKETRLLIAYGEPDELQMIQQVLGSLPAASTSLSKELDNLKSQIDELQMQIKPLLDSRVPRPYQPTSTPEEKSGK